MRIWNAVAPTPMMAACATTDSGPVSGPILYRELAWFIGVYEPGGKLPVGYANPIGRDGAGRTVFHLIVRGTVLPGRYIVVDRVFIEAAVDG